MVCCLLLVCVVRCCSVLIVHCILLFVVVFVGRCLVFDWLLVVGCRVVFVVNCWLFVV